MDSFYTDTRNYELSSFGEIVARVGKKKQISEKKPDDVSAPCRTWEWGTRKVHRAVLDEKQGVLVVCCTLKLTDL